MKFTDFTIFSLLVIAIVCTQDLRTAASINGRIANGQNAEPGQFPFQALLRVQKTLINSLCSGTLIDKNWILTAAHCTDNALSVSIALGTIFLDIESAEQSFEVDSSNIINHPDYSRLTFANDIALIYIPEANITDFVKPILLPQNTTTTTYVDYAANATGWGRLGDSIAYPSYELQWAQMEIVNNQICFQVYGMFITDNHLCVATPDKISTCVGDSGGPLVVDSNNVLAGVISFAHPAGCEKGQPVGFIKVNNYLNWITDTQNSFSPLNK